MTEEKKTAILLITDGSEEMEAVITADVLRRAGIEVTIVGLQNSSFIKCSRNVKICPDAKFADTVNNNYDAVILPGGLSGSKAFVASAEVGKLLQKQNEANKLIAAICAAPTALKAHNIGEGKSITSYPSVKDELCNYYKYVENQKVVVDGNIITSRGPATAFDFSLAIVEKLLNKKVAKTVADALLYEH